MRSISFRIFIFLFLFVIGTDCKLCAQQRRTTRVVVDNQVKGPAISANYVGLSYEIAMLKPNAQGKHYFSKDNKPLIRLYHSLGIKSVRLGGNSVDVKGGYTPNTNDIDELFGFARAAGIMIIYSVRLQDKMVNGKPSPDSNVDDAVMQAKYIYEHYADMLDYFAIGNEPGYYKNYEKDLQPRWNRIMQAMRNVAPKARFCAPDDNPNPTLCNKLWDDYGQTNPNAKQQVLGLLTMHSYSAGCSYKNPNTAKNHSELIPFDYKERSRYLLSDELVEENQRVYNQMERVFGIQNLPGFRLSETNSYWFSGLNGASNAHAAALWALDYMYWWAMRGNQGVNFHTGDRVGGDGMVPFYAAFISQGDGFDICPLSYALKAFGIGAVGDNGGQRRLGQVRLSGQSEHLAAYATNDGHGFTYVTIVNKDVNNGAGVRQLMVSLADGGQQVHSADYILLTNQNSMDDIAAEEKYLAKKGQLIGGHPIMPDGSLEAPTWNKAKVEKGQIRVELPPLSAVILKVNTGNFYVVDSQVEPMQFGKYKPIWSSLAKFEAPDWFRDAKFGIWAHWGPQSVPEYGDWYAHYMYKQGSRENKYHLQHFDHPSKVGFKDLAHQWKAENWNPEKLMALYKRAGAQYFVTLANHHDNFDLWDSQYHPWNATVEGPHKNIVKGWEQAARKAGLRFGVSIHSSRAWSWYNRSEDSDTSGVYKGVPYDGVLTKADGKGKWWEGKDPQVLYARGHALKNTGYTGRDGHATDIPDADYVENYYDRTLDVINKYKPDLLYFDDSVLPLWPVSDVGLKIAAHYYNSNALWHDGKQDGVITTKQLNREQQDCLVWDVERGALNDINPYPWQTCTCLGSWHYDRTRFTKNTYKTALRVVRMLSDIVSKNGNMLLSVPVRADGTIDEREVAILDSIGDWMTVNRECIFGTRPWVKYGEGPDMENVSEMTNPLGFNEANKNYTSADIRFTKKGTVLYAIVLQRPNDGKFEIRSLAGKKKSIKKVEILGVGKVAYQCDDTSLRLSTAKPLSFVPVVKITMNE